MFERFRSKERPVPAIERLESRLNELQHDVDRLQSASKRLELEWVETYDKVRHQLSRMARRGDLAKGQAIEDIVDQGANGEPEMDPVSAAILARRSRSFLGRSE